MKSISRNRRTLKASISLRGVGLHTGRESTVTLLPSDQTGRWVRRADLPGTEVFPLSTRNVSFCAWGTSVVGAGAEVRTVEHLSAALLACEIDDVLIEVDGPEMPILDGSALPFVKALEEAGVQPKSEEITPAKLGQAVWVQDGERHALALPASEFRVTYAVDYNRDFVGRQVFDCVVTPSTFREAIAPARTFALAEWVDPLREQGLAAGGSPENAIVVFADHYSTPLRFADELARHKALDLIGDLALLGRSLRAHVIAFEASHAVHVALARRIEGCALEEEPSC